MEINFLELLLVGLFLILAELPVELLRIKRRKQCKYDCSKCKVWDCPYHHCQYLKNKKGVKE